VIDADLYERALAIKEGGHYPESWGVEAIMVRIQIEDARWESSALKEALDAYRERMREELNKPSVIMRGLQDYITAPNPDGYYVKVMTTLRISAERRGGRFHFTDIELT
jgi:hypothetical protein